MTTSIQKFFSLLFLFSATLSMAQTGNWAYRAGGSSWDDVVSMHRDSDNKLLLTGMFQNTANFDTVFNYFVCLPRRFRGEV
jgi:tagatose-1,6-bisphosphate aldolase